VSSNQKRRDLYDLVLVLVVLILKNKYGAYELKRPDLTYVGSLVDLLTHSREGEAKEDPAWSKTFFGSQYQLCFHSTAGFQSDPWSREIL
jgi:hypothetical protein